MGTRSLGNHVRLLRRRHRLTQEQLAKRAGVGLRLVRDLEQGRRRNVSVGKVNAVLTLFGRELGVVPASPDAPPVAEPRARYLPGKKKVIIIAGPNGAGKTTLAGEFLPAEASLEIFINADLIACGLSPFEPETAALQAGRLMVAEIKKRVEREESFSFETTLSGLRYARAIPAWRREGYGVKLVFLRLDSPEVAVRRVAARVTQGGHNIPEAVIRRRFHAGRNNFEEVYKHIVDTWTLYDNSGSKPVLVSEGEGI
jgi:predicted ABC-type ATPase/DNA-binding XRE family transcriptional regulator